MCLQELSTDKAMATSNATDIDYLLALLERAGITLPTEQIADVTAEYALFCEQVALVNGVFTAGDDPALIFVAREPIDRE